jgi:hypothetical protein
MRIQGAKKPTGPADPALDPEHSYVNKLKILYSFWLLSDTILRVLVYRYVKKIPGICKFVISCLRKITGTNLKPVPFFLRYESVNLQKKSLKIRVTYRYPVHVCRIRPLQKNRSWLRIQTRTSNIHQILDTVIVKKNNCNAK